MSQCAGRVVEIAARAHADVLGDRDLNIGDALAPPQRLEQGIAEAQRHQVLHRRLAEVVVDAKGLLLAEDRAHHAVDLLRACQVVAERLFEHDPKARPVQADRTELLADAREEQRAGREVQHHGIGRAARALGQPRLQGAVVLGLREVDTAIVHKPREARELVVARPLGAFHFLEALLEPCAVLVVALLVARDREDASVRRQLAVPERLEQGRHQLAPGQITGATKEDEVEGHGLRCIPGACNLVTQRMMHEFL